MLWLSVFFFFFSYTKGLPNLSKPSENVHWICLHYTNSKQNTPMYILNRLTGIFFWIKNDTVVYKMKGSKIKKKYADHQFIISSQQKKKCLGGNILFADKMKPLPSFSLSFAIFLLPSSNLFHSSPRLLHPPPLPLNFQSFWALLLQSSNRNQPRKLTKKREREKKTILRNEKVMIVASYHPKSFLQSNST